MHRNKLGDSNLKMWNVLMCILFSLPCIQGEVLSSYRTKQEENIREEFQKEISKMKEEMTEIKGEIIKFKDENIALRKELSIQMVDKPSAAEETAHTDSNQEPGTISSQMRLLVPKRAANGEVVAFHANLRANTCFQPQEIIVFDNVVTNTMTAYDPLDGIFTAPVTGTYVFIWNFGSFGRSYNILELVVHGTGIGSSISDSENNISDTHPAAGFAVVHVDAGQRVFVRKTAQGANCYLRSDYINMKTTFSGWLLG